MAPPGGKLPAQGSQPDAMAQASQCGTAWGQGPQCDRQHRATAQSPEHSISVWSCGTGHGSSTDSQAQCHGTMFPGTVSPAWYHDTMGPALGYGTRSLGSVPSLVSQQRVPGTAQTQHPQPCIPRTAWAQCPHPGATVPHAPSITASLAQHPQPSLGPHILSLPSCPLQCHSPHPTSSLRSGQSGSLSHW